MSPEKREKRALLRKLMMDAFGVGVASRSPKGAENTEDMANQLHIIYAYLCVTARLEEPGDADIAARFAEGELL